MVEDVVALGAGATGAVVAVVETIITIIIIIVKDTTIRKYCVVRNVTCPTLNHMFFVGIVTPAEKGPGAVLETATDVADAVVTVM